MFGLNIQQVPMQSQLWHNRYIGSTMNMVLDHRAINNANFELRYDFDRFHFGRNFGSLQKTYLRYRPRIRQQL